MRPRRGFTIVELLVAAALIMFMMLIISQAFVIGLDSFRRLKAIGDMNERLRGVANQMRADLAADHFEGKKRMSDPYFWDQGPPREGFFRIWQGIQHTAGGPRNFIEGTDNDFDPATYPAGYPSYRGTGFILHFTVKKNAKRREDFFSARVPVWLPGGTTPSPLLFDNTPPASGGPLVRMPNYFNQGYDAGYMDRPNPNPATNPAPGWAYFNSPWAEVAYFLRYNGTFAGSTPLFTLYRHQRVIVPNDGDVNWNSDASGRAPITVPNFDEYYKYSEVSTKKYFPNLNFPDGLFFNNPSTITVPQRRFGMAYPPPPPQAQMWDGGIPAGTDPPNSAIWDATYPTYSDLPQPSNPALALQGADVLLSDVLSFDIAVLVPGASDFVDLYNSAPMAGSDPGAPIPNSSRRNPLFYHPQNNPNGPAVFDTWSSLNDSMKQNNPPDLRYDYSQWNTSGNATSVPLVIRPLAVRIQLRVWDLKTQQTRQITIIQDL
jgi:type II secretory pathway pseudopilin PulG